MTNHKGNKRELLGCRGIFRQHHLTFPFHSHTFVTFAQLQFGFSQAASHDPLLFSLAKDKMLSCKNLAYLTLYCHLPIIQRFKLFFFFQKKTEKLIRWFHIELNRMWKWNININPATYSLLQTIMNNIHTLTQGKTNLPANLSSLSSQNASLSFLFFSFHGNLPQPVAAVNVTWWWGVPSAHTLWLVAVAAPGVSDHRNKTRWEWIMGLNRTHGCHPHSINGWVLSLKGSDASFETRSARRLSVPAILPQCRISDEPVDTEAVCVRTNNLQPYGLKHASRDCIAAHYSSFLFFFCPLQTSLTTYWENFFSRVISREFSLATF